MVDSFDLLVHSWFVQLSTTTSVGQMLIKSQILKSDYKTKYKPEYLLVFLFIYSIMIPCVL